jgi:hypothetical protein
MLRKTGVVGLVAILAVVGTASGATSGTASHPDSLATLMVTDSVRSCPAGKTYSVFIQCFELDSTSSHNLFGEKGTLHSRPLRSRFLGPDLLQLLRRDSPDGAILGGSATLAYFRSTFSSALMTAEGGGIAVHIAPHDSGLSVRSCSLVDSLPSSPTRHAWLHHGHVLFVRVVLEDRPHAMLLYSPLLDESERMTRQREFMSGVERIATSHQAVVLPSEPKPIVLRALRASPPIGNGP